MENLSYIYIVVTIHKIRLYRVLRKLIVEKPFFCLDKAILAWYSIKNLRKERR